jgi:ABC-type Fe3+/spermidine/putrescine transport system ATPase subunit
MSSLSLLQVTHIKKTFPTSVALDDVSFDVPVGEIICLLGPSGCGKTTLLRIIAGLEQADAGQVFFNGNDLKPTPIHQRGFGLMFQDFALFPHKNVWDNVIFGVRMQHLDRAHIQRLGEHALELVGLSGFETRDVNELSGGEKQRVALARSLAPQPKLLMLDEPLGSLDRKLREELMIEVRRILKAARLTSIYVTHDQQEAFAVADRVVIMKAGCIEQIGSPREVYNRPRTEFVARFLGLPNLIEGTLASAAKQVASILTPIGLLETRLDGTKSITRNQAITVLIKPDAASIEQNPFARSAESSAEWFAETPRANLIDGTLIDASFRGRYNRVTVQTNDVTLVFELDAQSALPAIGDRVRIALNSNSIVVL